MGGGVGGGSAPPPLKGGMTGKSWVRGGMTGKRRGGGRRPPTRRPLTRSWLGPKRMGRRRVEVMPNGTLMVKTQGALIVELGTYQTVKQLGSAYGAAVRHAGIICFFMSKVTLYLQEHPLPTAVERLWHMEDSHGQIAALAFRENSLGAF